MARADHGSAAPATAATHAPKLTSKQLRQIENQNSGKYFAAGVVGLMALFVVYHWSAVILRRSRKDGKTGGTSNAASKLRPLRRLLLRRLYPFPTTAQGLVAFSYWATNLSVFLTRLDLTNLTNVAKRMGWMTMFNLALSIFLALKNTPLGPLAGLSHESLNSVHRTAGRTTVVCMILHSTIYINAWHQTDSLDKLTEFTNVSGINAGFFLLTILLSSLAAVRRRYYEFFYLVHLTMIVLILIFAGNHRPKFAQRAVYIPIVAASVWGADRLARFAKLVWNFYGNGAVLTALPNGATRITLSRRLRTSSPGSHIFLWIPAVRAFETHPFTLVASDPVELLASEREGFTRALHAYAKKHPGKKVRASIDGPYGAVPDFGDADRLMLIAGGTGATFTFGVATEMVRRASNGLGKVPKAIDFVWVFREKENLAWFAPQLRILRGSSLIKLTVHATRYIGGSLSRSSDDYNPHEKQIPVTPLPVSPDISPVQSAPDMTLQGADPEKGGLADVGLASVATSALGSSASSFTDEFPLKGGRAGLTEEIRRFVGGAQESERVVVAVCGPNGMTTEVREAVLECMRVDGPSITFHGEQFGW